MSSREEFETWLEQNKDFMLGTRKVSKGDCFFVWQASREALVIELPNRFAEKYQDYYDDVEGGCFNEARYISDLTVAIEAAGVKVKS